MTGAADSSPRRTSHTLSHRVEYVILRGVVAFFAALPRSLALRVGAWLGELFYLLDRRDRRIALFNLALAFPEKSQAEHRRILRVSCRNLGRTGAEICHLAKLRAEDVPRYVDFGDRAVWENVFAEAAKRGAVIVTAHFGNWEMLAYLHALLGRPITLVHRPMKNELSDGVIREIRTRPGTRAIAKKAAAKEALRTLKRKGVLVIPSDQNQTFSFGVFVDFFGKPACTTPGAARLAMMTGAAVFPVFLVREGESEQHRLVILPEIELADTGDRDRDVVTNTQRCSDAVQEIIRRYPEQWIWFHKRWKTRRPGEEKLYK